MNGAGGAVQLFLLDGGAETGAAGVAVQSVRQGCESVSPECTCTGGRDPLHFEILIDGGQKTYSLCAFRNVKKNSQDAEFSPFLGLCVLFFVPSGAWIVCRLGWPTFSRVCFL